jgi:hypothetical protein
LRSGTGYAANPSLNDHSVAIYTGALPIRGRVDELTFYDVAGQIRVRVRNPLSRKRVLHSPEFAGTRKFSGLLARASQIGSFIYQSLPEQFRQYWMYRAFVGEAMQLLKQGQMDAEVQEHLWKIYAAVWYVRPVANEIATGTAPEKKSRVKSRALPVTRRVCHKAGAPVKVFIRWKMTDKAMLKWDQDVFRDLGLRVPDLRAP